MKFKEFFNRLFFYLKEHIGKLLVSSFLMILASAMESAVPEITGQIIDNLFSDNTSNETAFLFSMGLFLLMFLSSIFSLTSYAGSTWVSNKVIMDIRVDMFSNLTRLPKSYFDKRSTGEILSKITFDVEQIAATASSVWLDLLKSFVTVIILIGYLFYKNWQLSLFLIILFPMISFVVLKTSARMRNSSKEVQKTMGDITSHLSENISGNHIIKIFQAQEFEMNKFDALVKKLRHQRFKLDMTGAFNTDIVKILIGIVLSLVVYISSTQMTMSAGEFLAYFTALAMLVKPIKGLVGFNKPIQKAIIAGQSVFDLIDHKSETNNGKTVKDNIKGDIEFNNVSFAYERDKIVLKNFSLKINHGESIAIVGSTGSGKSTIVDLIARFYLPISGEIKIDNKNINEYELNNLRSFISYVDQSALLFNTSIRENISIGASNISDKELEDYANASCAYEFINKLDQKFDFEIGENGAKLSGGQKQRLALARAFAKNAPIFIFDEATSALDANTEKEVQRNISNLSDNRTSIIIAHRLSTIKNADRIVFLKEGLITEIGTHEELLSKKGDYFKLFNSQFDSK